MGVWSGRIEYTVLGWRIRETIWETKAKMNKHYLLLVVVLFVATSVAKADEKTTSRANNDAQGQSRPTLFSC